MNKIVINSCDAINRHWGEYRIYSEHEFDSVMYERYGLKCIIGYEYEITDDSKLTLFMLNHSDAIEKISYE